MPARKLFQADAGLEIGEAGIGSQGVPGGIDFQVDQAGGTVVVGFLQPLEGGVLFAEEGVDQRDGSGLHVGLLGSLFEFGQSLAGLAPFPAAA